jgi:hypothetical protein
MLSRTEQMMHRTRTRDASGGAPSANAEHVPSVLCVTSTCTPMNFATVPSASLTGAVEDVIGKKPSRVCQAGTCYAAVLRCEYAPMVRKHQNGVPSCVQQ